MASRLDVWMMVGCLLFVVFVVLWKSGICSVMGCVILGISSSFFPPNFPFPSSSL